MARAWIVRGRKGSEEREALTRGFVMHGWDWLPDLSSVTESDDITVLLRPHADYRNASQTTITKHANELYAFVHEIDIGDLAVYPRWGDSEHLHAGRVISAYEYRDDLAPETRHVRRVQWLGQAVARSSLSDRARSELNCRGTIRELTPESAEEIEQAAMGRSAPVVERTAGDVDLPPARALQELVRRALADLGGVAHRRDLMRRALEIGQFSPEQRAIPAPPSKRGQYESQLDYRLSWALHHLHRDGAVERVEPSVWRLTS